MVAAAQPSTADDVLQRCLKAYGGATGAGGEVEQDSIQRLREHLTAEGAAVCLICLELLQREDPVWSCTDGCYDTVHLACIQTWALQQLQASRKQGEGGDTRAWRDDACWCCPKCRRERSALQVPSRYKCHCGKEADPAPSLWLAAHTCGATCGRALPHCGHFCLLLCHPGRCPACPRQVAAKCYCGKVETQKRCHQSHFSCGKLCGRRHRCGHRCPITCHEGSCPPCKLSSTRNCECGAEAASVPCARPSFRCERVCSKTLQCGRHRCHVACHAGPCLECPLTGPRACPCGKVTYEGLSCEDAAPACGGTCDRLLSCGEHRCMERCHLGPCPAVCRAMATRSCPCGRVRKQAPCCEVLRCERKCSRIRNCQRHPCRRRCCDGSCPPCTEECGRLLKCGNHRCRATCHAGACLPCPLQLRVACACGAASYRLPCGWEARVRPPPCTAPCPVRRSCRHANSLPPHQCHYGPCPPCGMPCGTELPCGHTCGSSTCHDARPPSVPNFAQPLPPQLPALREGWVLREGWAAQQRSNGGGAPPVLLPPSHAASGAAGGTAAVSGADLHGSLGASRPAAAEAAQAAEALAGVAPSPCAPCQVPVERWCLGHHTQQYHPCCDNSLASCGQPCGRQMGCGSHFADGVHCCSKPCHPTQDAAGQPVAMSPGTDTVAGCEVCQLSCGRGRGCGHPCRSPCHAGVCQPCNELRSRPCHCGRSAIQRPCHQFTQEAMGEQQILCCGKECLRPLPCGHLCHEPCHQAACPATKGPCTQEVSVRCHCRRQKEKWPCNRARAALQAQNRALPSETGGVLRVLPCIDACTAAKPATKPGRQPNAGPSVAAGEMGATVAAVPITRPAQLRHRYRRTGGHQDSPTAQSSQWEATMRTLRRRVRRNAVPAALLTFGLTFAALIFWLLS